MEEVIITSVKGVHIDVIQRGLEDGSWLGRVATVSDPMPLSDRNLKAMLDYDGGEVRTVRDRDEVLKVDRLSLEHIRTPLRPFATQAITPTFTGTQSATHDNWALDECTEQDGTQYRYSHEGEGVDVVIIDSGITAGHDEYDDDQGTPRLQQIEWQTNQNIDRPGHYTDVWDDTGHGSHVAGTVAGLTQGWARKARIYSMKLDFQNASQVNDPNGYGVIVALQLVRAWHNNKSGADAGRPTVVNNSWGFGRRYPPGHPEYRADPNDYRGYHPLQYTAVDAEIESMIAAGIHVVCAAGNDANIIANDSDPLYNEVYYEDGSGNYSATPDVGGTFYPNRCSPGNADGALTVSSLGNWSSPFQKDQMAPYSNTGSLTDVFAPGSWIQSVDRDGPTLLKKINGTSMASPQVAGIIAVYLSMNPTATHADVLSFLTRFGISNAVQNDSNGRTIGNAPNLTIRSIYNGLQTNDAGTWKTVKDPQAKDAGTWQPVKEAFKKVSGQWIKVFG